MAQTCDGYIWLRTREGLVRFDGARFTVSGLYDRLVNGIVEDGLGYLWFCALHGVYGVSQRELSEYPGTDPGTIKFQFT